MKRLLASLLLLVAGGAKAASCPPLTLQGLRKLQAERPIAKLVFFASWCGECKHHLTSADPETTLLIASFDEPERASAVLQTLGVKASCYSDQGLTTYFKIRAVPAEIPASKV